MIAVSRRSADFLVSAAHQTGVVEVCRVRKIGEWFCEVVDRRG